ncbi:uncharacterized protein LOC127108437 [Lathyrus oleraceus]|uniref:uncharacterized protein LOC127108437 n=1 Tax=Pisum sativum TaxID=3888 RepID=UPI0021D0D71C|nr:uncharacterized protein LOC127108437 [Pisum sativum]
MSNTLKVDGHTEEAKKLRMFLFTLAEEAGEWFYSLPAGSITTREEMEKAFLNEYFPTPVFLRKRYEILNFKQKDGETLGDTYKRFKRVLVACLTHNMDATEQMQMFVNGLKIKTKQLIDIAAGGSTNFSTAIGIKKIIEAIAANEHMELYDRCQTKPEGVIDLKMETTKTRIEDTIAAEVEKKLKAMNIGTRQVAQVQPTPTVCCEICNGPHQTLYCFAIPQQVEEIKFLNQNSPYSNTYNPGWKNHPNFSWKDQKATSPQHGQYQTQYQQHQQQQIPKKDEWEIAIEKMGMKIPIKKEDRGAVTVPCTIGDMSFNKALIDLGANEASPFFRNEDLRAVSLQVPKSWKLLHRLSSQTLNLGFTQDNQ